MCWFGGYVSELSKIAIDTLDMTNMIYITYMEEVSLNLINKSTTKL